MRRVAVTVCLALATLLSAPYLIGENNIIPKKTSKKLKRKKEHYLFVAFPELKPPLPKGTSLALQNRIADERNLPRAQNSEELHLLKIGESPHLVAVGKHLGCFLVDQRLANKNFKISVGGSRKKKKINEDFLYLNPNAVAYIEKRLAKRYCCLSLGNHHKTFMISALVRTQEYQEVLARANPNAREAIGDMDDNRSAHLTGYAFDISTRGHAKKELIDLARLLLEDKQDGLLAEAIFEPRFNNFHVMVFPQNGAPTTIVAPFNLCYNIFIAYSKFYFLISIFYPNGPAIFIRNYSRLQ